MWCLFQHVLGRSYSLGDNGSISEPPGGPPVYTDPQQNVKAASAGGPIPAETEAPPSPPPPASDRLERSPGGVTRDPRMEAAQQLVKQALRDPGAAKETLAREKKEAKEAHRQVERAQQSLGKAHKYLDEVTKKRDGLARDLAKGDWDHVQRVFESFDNSLRREDAQGLELLVYSKPPDARLILKKIKELQPQYPELSAEFNRLLDTKVVLGWGFLEWMTPDKPLSRLIAADQAVSDAERQITELQDSIKPLEDTQAKETQEERDAEHSLEVAKKYGEAQERVDKHQKEADGLCQDLAAGNWAPVQKVFESFDNSLRREDAQALEMLFYGKPTEPRRILAKIKELQPQYPELSARFNELLNTEVVLFGVLGIDLLKRDRALRDLMREEEERDKAAEERDKLIPVPKAPPVPPAPQPVAVQTPPPSTSPPTEDQAVPPPQAPPVQEEPPPSQQTETPTLGEDPPGLPETLTPTPTAKDEVPPPPGPPQPPVQPEISTAGADLPVEIAGAIREIYLPLATPPLDEKKIDGAIAQLVALRTTRLAKLGGQQPVRWKVLQEIQSLLATEIAKHLPSASPPLVNDEGKTTSPAVQWLQRALYLADIFDEDYQVRDIGDQGNLTNYDADGRFGPATQASLESFQARMKLAGKLTEGQYGQGRFDSATSQAMLQFLNPEGK